MKTSVDLKNYFIQIEKDFNQASKERGAEGWASYFAEDGEMVGKDVIAGREAIRKAMENVFALPGFSFKWEPTDVYASDDQTIVITTGNYERKFLNKEGEMLTSTGKYTSIWKRQADGSYKIIHDIGN